MVSITTHHYEIKCRNFEFEQRFSKENEFYLIRYNEENKAEAIRAVGKMASNPELNLSWYDAAVLTQRIRKEKSRI